MDRDKNIVLCPNPYRDLGLQGTLEAKKMLESAGFHVLISLIYGSQEGIEIPQEAELTPIKEAIENAGLVVTFGGDGSILHTSRAVIEKTAPIIGINLGYKGFLTALEKNQIGELLAVAEGEYVPSPRMMIDVQLIRNGKVIYSDNALNDAVVTGIARSIQLTVMGDGQKITAYSGDGVILATPTGSTAYSMSAGGPIVEPTAENIILTPICAHMFTSRSFVLAPERVVLVKVGELNERRAVLSVDGGDYVNLESGDEIQIKKSDYKTLLVLTGKKSFYDIVYEKLEERNR